MNPKRIFLSHAVKDKKLANMLVDLITSSGAVTPDEVFCTSLEGLGVPPGKDFLEVIKKELQDPDLVISLISGNYLNSQFCMCELGASWAMSHSSLPILVPPLTYKDLSTVISTQQAILLNDSSSLNGMTDQIIEILNKEKINTSRWEAKREEFIERFNKELSVSYNSFTKRDLNEPTVSSETDDDIYLEFKKKYLKSKTNEEKEDVILLMLSEESDFRSELSQISDALDIKNVLCQYHIDFLLDKNFVEKIKVEGLMGLTATCYFRLTKDGRHYLIENAKV